MPASIQLDLTAITAQVAATEAGEASAIVVINAIATAVKNALAADNALDDANTAAAQQVVDQVVARFAASAKSLADAITATPSPTP